MPESRTPPEETREEPPPEPRSEESVEPEPQRVPPAAEKGVSILDQLRESFRIRY